MRKLFLWSICSLLFMTFICQCNKDKNDPALAGYKWKITKVDGYNMPIADLQKDAYLQFENDSLFSAAAGCNKLVASYTAGKTSMKISSIGGTKTLCDAKYMDLEDAFKTMTKSVTGYAIIGKKLEFTNGENVVAEFERE